MLKISTSIYYLMQFLWVRNSGAPQLDDSGLKVTHEVTENVHEGQSSESFTGARPCGTFHEPPNCPHIMWPGSPRDPKKHKAKAIISFKTQPWRSYSVIFTISYWLQKSSVFSVGGNTQGEHALQGPLGSLATTCHGASDLLHQLVPNLCRLVSWSIAKLTPEMLSLSIKAHSSPVLSSPYCHSFLSKHTGQKHTGSADITSSHFHCALRKLRQL